MQGQINPKIVGASIIGFALVAGAYTLSSLNKPTPVAQQANLGATTPMQRVAIEVVDSDGNGIEDWRDEFVTSEPVILDTINSPYTPPDTVTGQMSIDFMEGIIRSRNYGPFGQSQDEVIDRTVDDLAKEAEGKIYSTKDIDIMQDWDDEDIVNYANTVAATLYRNSNPDLDGELEILQDIVRNDNRDRVSELTELASVYAAYRDDTLKIPVPAFAAKEHLDLINTYQAIHEDIAAMSLIIDDPVVSLLRLKRYQDDATGLALALQNMYLAFEQYADLFTAEDPAALFVLFSPDIQI
jgi:hypothetical protein